MTQCGLRRSEVVGLRLDQLQLRESHWVIVDLVGKGGRVRTVPVPAWCKGLVDVWLRHSSVSEGKLFRRVLKNGARQDAGVTANVVWYAVKRCAKRAGIENLAPHDLRRSCVRLCHGCGGELEQIQFLLATLPCKRRNGTSDASRTSKKRSMTDLESQSQAMRLRKLGNLDSG
jgi:integrase